MNDLDLGFTEEEPRTRSRRHAGRRRRERRRRRRGRVAAAVALVVVVLILGGVAWGGYSAYHKMTAVPDYAGAGKGHVTVHVTANQTGTAIGMELEKLDVVKSTKAFVKAWEANPDSANIQPGYYRLKKQMSAKIALKTMLDPQSKVQWRITVQEGLRAKKTLALLAKQTRIPLTKFQAAVKKPSSIGLPAAAKGNVEGYLFPATYEFPPGSTATTILRAMVARYVQEETNLGLDAKAQELGLTTHQVLTLASLLEAEARTKDFSKVSRVVYNRLHKGMQLQFDSTILYALGRADFNVTYKDTKVDSPYNTYTHKGLPPGPVDSPGSAALKAALDPTPGNWLYFVTTNPKTGETKFTADPAEFQKFKQEFKRNKS